MQVTQAYTLVNSVVTEILGEGAVVNEDLSNIVDIGTELFSNTSVDNYVKKLVDRIGRVIFVDRPYSGNVPSILMDSFEFGAVVEKIQADLPAASENESWSLTNGESYDPNVFYQPTVSAKFFNKRVTFEIDMSFTDRQVKGSFASANELNAFLTMLYNSVEKALTIRIDSLIMRTINNFTAEVLDDSYNGTGTGSAPNTYDFTGVSGDCRSVNLLAEYKAESGATLTADKALTDPEFLKYAARRINTTADRLTKISTLFNVGGKERFTPADYRRTVMLSDFARAVETYLLADTYHEGYVGLPAHDTVPYWQGSGTDYAFDSISAINVKTASGKTIDADGILCVMFDRDACAVANLDRRVTTNYNPKAEFYNNFYKFDAGYYNDLNENFVVFFIA